MMDGWFLSRSMVCRRRSTMASRYSSPFGDGLNFVRTVAVGLDIGFVQDVEAVLVGQVVPLGHVGIMAGANGVDVVLLHQPDVRDHHLARDHLAKIGIELVAVHAFDHQLLAVEQNLIALDLRLPEADAPRDHFEDAALRVLQRENQLVEIRRLGGPFLRALDGLLHVEIGLFAGRHVQLASSC